MLKVFCLIAGLLWGTLLSARIFPENITTDFFDFTQSEKLFYQSDFLKQAESTVFPEIRRRYPELTEVQARKIAANFLNLRTPGIPRKSKEEYGFMEFLAIEKFMVNSIPNVRHKKRFIPYGLKLAQKYPDNLTAAQLVFRGLKRGQAIEFIAPDTVKQYKLHPYLSLMLQGEYFMRLAWKMRGGGFADTVTEQGWKGFEENVSRAARFFEEAHKKYPHVPEAAAALIETAHLQNRKQDNKVYYLKKALQSQADYFDAMSSYTWYSRPRWCGSAEGLLADAKMFFALRNKHPRLAKNGLHLLQAYLTEISAKENISYFSKKENYTEIKELFEKLSEKSPLSPGEKMYWGTAALLAGDYSVCESLIRGFSAEDRTFAKTLRRGGLPQLYWFNFPSLFKALKKQSVPADAAKLESVISSEKDGENKKALIELYIILHGNIDRLDFRGWMPGVYRLCSDFDNNKKFLEKVLTMGADLEAGSPVTGLRPLYFGMKYKKGPELLALLLKHGADPNAKWGNHPPLYCSFLYNFKEERIRQLFAAGADPDQKFGSNFTALHGCVKRHDAVKLLIEFKANLNVVSKYGQTPLDLAQKYGSPQTVKLLRDNGARKASEL